MQTHLQGSDRNDLFKEVILCTESFGAMCRSVKALTKKRDSPTPKRTSYICNWVSRTGELEKCYRDVGTGWMEISLAHRPPTRIIIIIYKLTILPIYSMSF